MVSGGVRRRSWLAVVAVLSVVGSLLAVGFVPPAGGTAGEADNEALFSACVGPALESQGLVDVEGSFAEDAVNCLAHYEVTTGRTETMYDPGAPVQRWQMALFLSRAAVPAAVSLPAELTVEITDLDSAPEVSREAIRQMAQLEIMPAFRGGAFSPMTDVSRADMAFMLDAFLGLATPGTGAFGGAVMALKDVSPDDEVFGDIEGVSRTQYSAIRRMFEVGVARGTSDDAFSPGGRVTRAQMAVFITRMLAHTVARPRGLTLQASETAVTTDETVDLAVSVRGTDLMPLDALVNVFSATEPDDAFGEDGRCATDAVAAVTDGTACQITTADPAVDPSGDYLLEGWEQGDDSLTVWAWSGEVGDRYDSDDVTAPSIAITVTKPGTKLKVSDDMAANATAAKFGATVTFTVQVVDDDGEDVALKDVAFSAQVSETVDSGAEGVAPVATSYGRSYKTDADGKVEFTFRQNDPRSGERGDKAWLDLDIFAGKLGNKEFKVDDKTTLKMAGVSAGDVSQEVAAVVWLDTASAPLVLKLTQAVEYHEASNTGTSHAVTGTLTDQYGDPVSRQQIGFTSDDTAGIGHEQGLLFDPSSEGFRVFTVNKRSVRTTNRNGEARLSYTRESADSGIETIMAVAELGAGDADDITADRIYHYWASEPGNGASAEGRIMLADDDNNTVILAGSAVSLVKYDSNDQLNSTTGAVTLTDFEKELTEDDTMAKYMSVSNYQKASKNVSRFTSMEEPLMAVFAYPAVAYDRADRVNDGALRTSAVDAFYGRSFAAGGGVFIVGSPGEASRTGVDDAGRVYIFEGESDADPVVVARGDAAVNSMFGSTVAISDDGNVIAVSKLRNGGTDFFLWQKEAAQTWENTEGAGTADGGETRTDSWGPSPNWPQDHNAGSWNPSQSHNALMFSDSLAFSGDGAVMVVGAPGSGLSAAAAGGGSGSVFVYPRTTSGAYALSWDNYATNTSPPDNWRVSGGSRAGVAIVPGEATDTVANFGGNNAIAVSEDGSVVVVGAPEADIGAAGKAGAVYVYVNDEADRSAWLTLTGIETTPVPDHLPPTAKLSASRDGTADEMVGASVDISDDGSTIVAYAPGSGNTYVWVMDSWANSDRPVILSNGADSPADMVRSPYPSAMARNNVAVKADGSEIVVGNGNRADGDWRGSVAVYTRGAAWTDRAVPSVEYIGSEVNQRLGWSIAYDQSTGTIYASGYKPTYEDVDADTNPDTDDVRQITKAEYTIYKIDRS